MRRLKVAAVTILGICVLLLYVMQEPGQDEVSWVAPTSSPALIVDTPGCTILELDANDPALAVHFKGNGHPGCAASPVQLENRHFKFNQARKKYVNLTCCYQSITRVGQDPTKFDKKADSQISISKECKNISKDGTIGNDEFVQVNCKYDAGGRIKSYKDFYASIPEPSIHNSATKEKMKYWRQYQTTSNTKFPPPNVLIIGIDSVSRLSSMRTMPKTRNFLLDNDFIEMRGYTKVGYNTFPNLMALTLGKYQDFPCWKDYGDANNCPFIWQNYSRHQYITGFVEDRADISVFNFVKTGFVAPPADYYYRPFSLAYHDQLSKSGDCVGGLSLTSYMLKYVKEFAEVIGKARIPYFLFSWFTAAHEGLNEMKAVDTKLLDLVSNVIQVPRFYGENTIVIVMADHGKNYGEFRETYLGYFEVTLPLFFIRLPPSIKAFHPNWYENLNKNSNRPTSPLDVHATLEDILRLSAPASRNTTLFPYTHSNWGDSPQRSVFSLFEAIPANRTCRSAGIPEKYCRCGISPLFKEDIAQKPEGYGEYLVKAVNSFIDGKGGFKNKRCVPLKFKRYLYLRELRSVGDEKGHGLKQYLVAVETSPSDAHFETVIQVSGSGKFHIEGEINRINSYGTQSLCVRYIYKLWDFCFCRDFYEAMLKESRNQISRKAKT